MHELLPHTKRMWIDWHWSRITAHEPATKMLSTQPVWLKTLKKNTAQASAACKTPTCPEAGYSNTVYQHGQWATAKRQRMAARRNFSPRVITASRLGLTFTVLPNGLFNSKITKNVGEGVDR